MNKIVMRLTASGLVLALTAIGCKPAGQVRALSAGTVAPERSAAGDREAARATAALKAGRTDKALAAAEAAVARAPDQAGHRALLGRVYLAAGRFASAETALTDARTLAPAIDGVALPLALAQLAQGKDDAARATLDGARDLAARDRGLALALAGEERTAIALLETAVRDGGDAATRQNLALAYALAGRWDLSMRVAAVDVPKGKLTQRMMQWSRFAADRNGAARVAMLLGTVPANDPGLPTALALAPPVAAPIALAEVAVPTPAPTPILVTLTPPAPIVVAAAPALVAPAAPVIVPVPSPTGFQVAALRAATPLLRPVVARAETPRPTPTFGTGSFVVQLGAFSSAARVEAAWDRLSGKVARLGHAPSTSTTQAGAATLHRLALTGFATRAGAVRVCGQVQAAGGDCFVRAVNGDAPVRWAQAREVRRG